MAIEAVCPEISISTMSPRISFSHDFCQTEAIPVEKRPNSRSNSSGLNSSIDFDFCVRESFNQDSSSADEIFSDGKILPLDIKKKQEESPLQMTHTPQLPESKQCLKKDRSKEIKATNNNDSEEKQNSKSFWRFKRSSSCGSRYSHSLCPLPLLSRSNSTGSAPKDGVVNNRHNNSHKKNSAQSSNSMSYQKPPLKKVHGVQVNPILNVHSGNLFGLGSVFSSGKDRSKKK